MLPAEFGWSDLGSWSSLRILLSQDEAGNAKVGEDMIRYESILYQIHVVTRNPLSNAHVTLMQEKLTSSS